MSSKGKEASDCKGKCGGTIGKIKCGDTRCMSARRSTGKPCVVKRIPLVPQDVSADLDTASLAKFMAAPSSSITKKSDKSPADFLKIIAPNSDKFAGEKLRKKLGVTDPADDIAPGLTRILTSGVEEKGARSPSPLDGATAELFGTGEDDESEDRMGDKSFSDQDEPGSSSQSTMERSSNRQLETEKKSVADKIRNLDYDGLLEYIIKFPGRSSTVLTVLYEKAEEFRNYRSEEVEIWEEFSVQLCAMPPTTLTAVMTRLSRYHPMSPQVLSAFLDGMCTTHSHTLADRSAEMFKNLTKVTEFCMKQYNTMKSDMTQKKREMSALLVQLREATACTTDFKATVEKFSLQLSKLDITPPIVTTRSEKSKSLGKYTTSSSEDGKVRVRRIEGTGVFKCTEGTVEFLNGKPIGIRNSTPMFKEIFNLASLKSEKIAQALFNKSIPDLISAIELRQNDWQILIDPEGDKQSQKMKYLSFMKSVKDIEYQWIKLD